MNRAETVIRSTSSSRNRRRQSMLTVLATGLLVASMAAPAAHARGTALQPAYGGTVSYATLPAPTCLDPEILGSDLIVGTKMSDTLVTQDDHGRLRADLAVRWTFSHGGKWLTFYLRHGVRFSNGDPFDARAVKYSLDRMRNPASHAILVSGLNGVRNVKVIDRYTVRLIMATPLRTILPTLANPYGPMDDAKTAMDTSCQYPVGTGAFKVTNVGPGFSSVTMTRNPYHTWERPDAHNRGRAYLSTFVVKYVANPVTEANELLNGDTDITMVSGDQLDRVRQDRGVALHRVLRFGVFYLGFNTSHPPFNKLAVRRAIAEAIDRKSGIIVSLGGLGVPAYSPIPQVVGAFYDKSSKRYAIQYKPADARRLLAANHVGGPYTLFAPSVSSYQAGAEFIQAELAQVGVTVNIVTGDNAAHNKAQFDLDMARVGMTDPDNLYWAFDSRQTVDNGGQNVTFYRSATLDSLLKRGRTTVNIKKARKIYDELQRYMDTHVVMAPLWTDLTMMGVRSRVHGWHTEILGFDPLAQDLYVRMRASK